MVTAAKLEAQTSRELAQQAKLEGVRGWHGMRKAELVEALLAARQTQVKSSRGKSRGESSGRTPVRTTASRVATHSKRPPESKVAKLIRIERQRQENQKDLSVAAGGATTESIERDRIALIVRDAWWLQAYWEISRPSVQRARVALAQHWHNAQPMLRLFEVTSEGNTNSVERSLQDIPVNGDARNWFLSVPDSTSTKTYRVAIGYLTAEGQFHQIAKSNEVVPPAPTASSVDDNWADISDEPKHFFALSGGQDPSLQSGDLSKVFASRTGQPVGGGQFGGVGNTADLLQPPLCFDVDAQMVVYGSTDPAAMVTIAGQPVRVQADGTFAQRISLPERRQVLPVVASTRDGSQQQTTVLAIERNTKNLGLVRQSPGESA